MEHGPFTGIPLDDQISNESMNHQQSHLDPSTLCKEMQSSFPLCSDRYWVKAHKSICSYR